MARAVGELEQTLLFALVALGPDAPGLELRREVLRRTGRELSPGAVYTALSRLEERGYVRSELAGGSESRGGRPRRLYAIEPSGLAALARSYRHVTAMADGLVRRLGGTAEPADP